MKRERIVQAVLGLVFFTTCSPVLQAAEIKILCSTALRGVLGELGPQFEKATGNTLVVTYDTSVGLKERIDKGESFDLTVLTPALLDDLIAHGKVAADSRKSIAKVGMAIAIRTGARRPDISTVDAVKRTLLEVKSLEYASVGAAGLYFAQLIKRLGLEEALKAKTKLGASGAEVGQAVAKGEVEIGIMPVSEIVATDGAEVLGLFPPEIQEYAVMVGGAAAVSKNGSVVKRLLEFLSAPAAVPVMKRKGMEPV